MRVGGKYYLLGGEEVAGSTSPLTKGKSGIEKWCPLEILIRLPVI